jgi:uncharacterized metal-binding protein YceD (DUF177 family)
MKIIISNLAEGEHLYNFVQSAEELGFEDYTFKDKIKINIKLFKGNRQIILGVSFNCSVVFPCDRCLDDFDMNLNGDFNLIYEYAPITGVKASDAEDNLFFISPEANNVELTEVIREYIIISIPMKRTPEEKDGVCVYCDRRPEEILRVRESNEVNPVWNKLINRN